MKSGTLGHSLLAAALALVCVSVGAATLRTDRVWFGGSGDWDNPDNWDPPGIPGTNAVDRATIGGGTVTLGSAYTIGALDVGAAELDASADVTVSGTAQVIGGTVTGSGDLNAHTVVLDGGVVTEGLNDCCSLVATDVLELHGPNANTVGRTLVNQGAGSWLGGDLDLTGGTLRNEVGATFTVSTTTDASVSDGAVENAGSWVMQGNDCCSLRIASDFLNTGTVDVLSGVMEAKDCCSFRQDPGGMTTVAAGAALHFTGGTHELGGSVSGDGEVGVSAGALTVPAGSSYAPALTSVVGATLTVGAGGSPGLPTLDLAGGTFVTDGDLAVDEGRLTAGTAKAKDCCNLTFTGTLELSGPDPKRIEGTVESLGAGSWTGGDLDLSTGRLVNGAGAQFVVETTSDVAVTQGAASTGAAVENLGTWILRAQDCCSVTGDFDFQNSGTLAVQSGTLRLGLTCVNPGTPEEDCWNLTQSSAGARTEVSEGATLAAEVRLADGLLTGSGRIEGLVTNGFPPGSGARVEPAPTAVDPPSSYVLTLDGDYVQTADGTLTIDLVDAGNAGFPPANSLLAVSGSATLDGTLELSADPDFDPAAGDTFEVLTWGSRTGEFGTVTGADLAGPLILDAAYENGGLVLRVNATEGPAMVATSGAEAPPAATEASPGDTHVPMLQAALAVEPGGDHGLVESVTLQASGGGDDATGVRSVALHRDVDGDGALGAGDETLATGSYAGDDAQLELTLANPLRIEAGSAVNLLVTYDLSSSTASAGPTPFPTPDSPIEPTLLLALLALTSLLPIRLSKRGRGVASVSALILVALAGTSCNGDSTGPGSQAVTYTAQVVGVGTEGETSGKAGTVAGLPVNGTVLTVTP